MLWLPSLLVGGLCVWQYLGVPIILVLTVRLLLRPWAVGRLGSAAAVARMLGGVTLAGLWLAAAISYRVLEVPLVADRLGLAGFRQIVAADSQNEAGPRSPRSPPGNRRSREGRGATRIETVVP